METVLLSRTQKTFFKKEIYVALISVLLGLWIWLSLFRLVQISDNGKNSYSLILLKEPKVGDVVAFNYPTLNSPLRTSEVTKDKAGLLIVSLGDETEPLNEDLVVGILLF